MEQERNDPRFPEQPGSRKIHGESDDEDSKKEKYIRDGGKIEDYPSQDDVAKMKSEPSGKNESPLTDVSGEEKREDYINTDERKKDLDGRR